MMKAILGSEVRIDDTIDLGQNLKGKVLEYLGDDSSGRRLRLDVGHVSVLSSSILGLLHRPAVAGGKSEEDMVHDVISWAACVARLGEGAPQHPSLARYMGKLREALDVCELAKPLAEDPPHRNESLVDRHMIP